MTIQPTQTLPITTLFVDIGGVLLTNGWSRKSRALASTAFGLNLAELEERHHLTFDTYEVGKLTLTEYLDRIVFYQPRSFTEDTFRQFIYSQSAAFPDMIDLIRQLKAAYGLKVAVISNEGRELNQYRIDTFRLSEFIDFFVSSSFVHFRKPDADIFKVALDIAQAPIEQIVYIDDRALFVSVAEGLGVRGIRHVDYETTRAELAALGLRV
ncbi:HAD family phosphatase [Fibrella sp. HMF5335]|uniref:HAD family phosphatase n=1 Tax=Fibrella rubiginis TaxID=2817060 RepID=A0A939K6K0_9BACT|nr:HAD family phosphatase [Fibrella rubiginis]MBO0938918.1 HAD family phosphatase [Fibrella rubiginis]